MCNVYMRPWTLCVELGTPEVPFLGRLGISPEAASQTCEQTPAAAAQVLAARSHTRTWNWYIDGHVVSHASRQYIMNLLNACCIQNPTDRPEDSDAEKQHSDSSEESDTDGGRGESTITKVLYGKYDAGAGNWWSKAAKHEAAVNLGRTLWELSLIHI